MNVLTSEELRTKISMYRKIALIASIFGLIIFLISTFCGGTMFGYINTDNWIMFKLQHLFPLTYCCGAIVIYSAYKSNSSIYAIIGLLELLFLPFFIGLLIYDPEIMWIQG